MGEAKIRLQEGNGEGVPRVSTHIVEVITLAYHGSERASYLAREIEEAYTRLSERAKNEDSMILNVVQSSPVFCSIVENNAVINFVVITITAQRIGRADLEHQQRMARLGQR